MKPTLLILAAGMGSRYGGLKQIDGFGPNGETIVDYSIYDAIKAGFGKVVFIIREHLRQDFIDFFGGKFDDKIEVEYVSQELHMVPDGSTYSPSRSKPWGTGHAVLVAKDAIKGPFAVINADDYYGVEAYQALVDFFEAQQKANKSDYAVIAYYLKNTLSDHGTVNRGVCAVSDDRNLLDIEECTKIARNADQSISYPDEQGKEHFLEEDTLVSMNMFGFMPSYFEYAESQFRDFLAENGEKEKAELYIPSVLDRLIKNGVLDIKVIDTNSSWFGVTYKEDKPVVMDKLNKLIDAGVYPQKLW